MALSYDVCVYILYDHPAISFVTEWDSPYSDLAEIYRNPTVDVFVCLSLLRYVPSQQLWS